ncbi:MAG: phosphatidate cytidylyltransferase [Pseudomonadota bacterium]
MSALALAGVALAATIAGVTSFAILICFIVSVLCWEWGRMVRDEDGGVTFLLHALFALLACVLAALDLTMLALVSLAIGAVIVGATRYGNLAGVSALGLFYIGVPAVALIWLRSDASHGLSAVLFVFMIVWTADTAAFVGGRLIGGAKLFPSISPNKTWSGFLTSLVAAAVVGAGFAFVLEHSPHVQLAMTGVILAIAAQIGDLCESALKRGYGVKDASGLIPGHGGFMDRLDGQIFASGVAAVLGVAMNWHAPAQGLLYW